MKKILAVDDDPSILDSLDLLLEDEGYERILAPNCQIAKENLKKNNPDLVLVDMRLPDGSGTEFAQEVKKMSEKSIPIILISANYAISQQDKQWVDDFVPKPFDISTLSSKIKTHLPS